MSLEELRVITIVYVAALAPLILIFIKKQKICKKDDNYIHKKRFVIFSLVIILYQKNDDII